MFINIIAVTNGRDFAYVFFFARWSSAVAVVISIHDVFSVVRAHTCIMQMNSNGQVVCYLIFCSFTLIAFIFNCESRIVLTAKRTSLVVDVIMLCFRPSAYAYADALVGLRQTILKCSSALLDQ